jgi:hypothetical protein
MPNLLASLGVGAANIVYLLRDQFTTNASAPLSSPRTAEPGPGTLTITDTGNRLSIVGNRLIGASHATIAGASAASAATYARAGGGKTLACTVKRLSGSRAVLFFYTDSSNAAGLKMTAAGFVAIDGGTGPNDPAIFTQSFPDSDRAVAVVMRPTAGALYIVDGNLEWASAFNSTPTPGVYFELSQTGTSLELDDLRVVTLSGDWAMDWAIATNRTASPSSGATSTMTADGLVEFTWTAATGETIDLVVRSTDTNNRWILRCDQAAGNIKLFEKNGGTETQRGSTVTQTFTNGSTYRLTVKCVGTSIKSWAQTSTGATTTIGPAYASATFNQTSTGVAVSGFATGANLVCWPRTISLPNF